jgi:phosphatidate cytidylyltransferase
MISKRVSLGADFGRRAFTALVGAPLVIGLIMSGNPLWDALVIGVALFCIWELQRMINPNSRIGLLGMVAIALASFASFQTQQYVVLAIAILLFFVLQVIRALMMRSSGAVFLLRYFGYAALGALYISIPLSLLLGIRYLPQGALWTIIVFLSNWSTDALALIGGRLIGRTKLAPQISPGKTIEGAFIGLVGGFIVSMLASVVLNVPLATAVWISLAVPVFTMLGDLLESWIKRYFAVKDAGSILPGHGGLMDRVDGMLLAGPAVYLILILIH